MVYLHPDGVDALPCSRSAPCENIYFAVAQTDSTRSHVVFLPGTYQFNNAPGIHAGSTTTPSLTLHGSGSTLRAANTDGLLSVTRQALLRDFTFDNTAGNALYANGTIVLEGITLRGPNCLYASGNVTMRDVHIRSTGTGLTSGTGAVKWDGGSIRGGTNAIRAFRTAFDVRNVIIAETSGVALDVEETSGTMEFVTLAHNGTSVGTGPTAVRCPFPSSLSFRSSILWTPGLVTPPVEGSCQVTASIVGPTGMAGNTNANPVFVNVVASDYRISAGSPARDVANAGPALDFEGQPRPAGTGFDLGADEFQQ